MPDLIKGNRDTLPDHMTPSGDVVAAQFVIDAIALDNMRLRSLKVTLYSSRALSVEGHCGEEVLELLLLDHAIDELRGYHAQNREQLSIPGKDVSLPDLSVARVDVYGPCDDRPFAIAVLESAKQTLVNTYMRQKAQNGAARIIL